GGAGMVIQAEPIFKALKKIGASKSGAVSKRHAPHVLYLSPQGRVFSQAHAQELAQRPRLVMICGHYEGIDERAMKYVDEEVSIGDYVLTAASCRRWSWP